MTMWVNKTYLLCLLALVATACKKSEKQPDEPTIDSHPELVAACQHIEGGGAAVTGGDGGTVHRVSRLDDALDPGTGLPMKGTLRYAVTQLGARRVIFNVSGTIHLTSELRIQNNNLTIDGQSAPGDGICIADYPLVIDNANNVIVRYIRVRLGDASKKEFDAVSVNNSNGVVLDHLSCSWSVDECVSCYGNTNFTMQYCIVSESLRNSVHGKGRHGYGGIWGGTNASFHHNLLAHHDSRNPRFDHSYVNNTCFGPLDYVNNVVYNWGGNSTYGGEGTNKGAGGRHINMVNNYYKYGPSTSKKNRLVDPTVSCSDNCGKKPGGTVEPGKFFLSGNYMFGDANVTKDNWQGSTQKGSNVKATKRWKDGMTLLTKEQNAEDAFETVLTKAGCSLKRDAIDTRIVSDVRNGKGKLINSPDEAGGYPVLNSDPAPLDTDQDGMPDSWEDEHGLDKTAREDGKQYTLNENYTNLEVYLNELVQDLY